MSQVADSVLTTAANVIGNETVAGANTAARVSNMLIDSIDSKINNDKIETDAAMTTALKTVAGRDAVKSYVDTGLALKSNLSTPKVLVTTTTVLTDSAYGKFHVCSGTSADYTVTLPTAVDHEGEVISILGDPDVAVLNKAITVEGDGTEKVGRYLNQVITTGGHITLIARETAGVGSWDIIAFDQGAYITWTPTFVGLSGHTTDYRYKMYKGELHIITYHATVGVGAGTTLTFTLPRSLTSKGVNYGVAGTVFNNNNLLTTPGKYVVADGSNIVQCFSSPNTGAWSGTGDREILGSFICAIN